MTSTTLTTTSTTPTTTATIATTTSTTPTTTSTTLTTTLTTPTTTTTTLTTTSTTPTTTSTTPTTRYPTPTTTSTTPTTTSTTATSTTPTTTSTTLKTASTTATTTATIAITTLITPTTTSTTTTSTTPTTTLTTPTTTTKTPTTTSTSPTTTSTKTNSKITPTTKETQTLIRMSTSNPPSTTIKFLSTTYRTTIQTKYIITPNIISAKPLTTLATLLTTLTNVSTISGSPSVTHTSTISFESSSTTTSVPKVSTSIRLEDGVIPGCSSTGWNITVYMTVLKVLDHEITTNHIYFGDSSCLGIERGQWLIFQQGFRECLTSEKISDGAIIYENNLYYELHDPVHPFIVRQHKWTYGVECDVIRNEATSSHVHHETNVHHSAVTSHYVINMTFYSDINFMNQLPGNPIRVNIGDDVYVKVFTTASDWSVKLRLHTCFAKPSEDADDNMNYYIIKDGCEVDTNTHIISQSTHETRFVFKDFEYTTNREGFNIYCNATFCETKDYSPGCAQSCNSFGTQALVGKK